MFTNQIYYTDDELSEPYEELYSRLKKWIDARHTHPEKNTITAGGEAIRKKETKIDDFRYRDHGERM